MGRVLAVVMMVVGLAGCAAQSLVDRHVGNLPPDKSAEYRDGYQAGCHSGLHEACMVSSSHFERNDEKMKQGGDYALGWNDAVRYCALPCGRSIMIMPTGK